MLNIEDIGLRHPRSQSTSLSHLLVSEVIQQHPEMHFEDKVGQVVHGALAENDLGVRIYLEPVLDEERAGLVDNRREAVHNLG